MRLLLWSQCIHFTGCVILVYHVTYLSLATSLLHKFPASHCGGLGFIPGISTWGSWWMK